MPAEEVVRATVAAVSTAGGLGGVGWTAKSLLGPLFGDIAEGWRARHEIYRVRNLDRILEKAVAKSGEALNEPGSVHPRVGQLVLQDGSWCDDGVVQEYFAGVLATSRHPDGSDDRGITWARLVAGLPSAQVRSHYLLYGAGSSLLRAVWQNVGVQRELDRFPMSIPGWDLQLSLGLDSSPEANNLAVVQSLRGLFSAGLIGRWMVGDPRLLTSSPMVPYGTRIVDNGVVVTLTTFGIEFFLWAHGRGDLPVQSLTDANAFDRIDEVVRPLEKATLVASLPIDPVSHGGGGGGEEGEEGEEEE